MIFNHELLLKQARKDLEDALHKVRGEIIRIENSPETYTMRQARLERTQAAVQQINRATANLRKIELDVQHDKELKDQAKMRRSAEQRFRD